MAGKRHKMDEGTGMGDESTAETAASAEAAESVQPEVDEDGLTADDHGIAGSRAPAGR